MMPLPVQLSCAGTVLAVHQENTTAASPTVDPQFSYRGQDVAHEGGASLRSTLVIFQLLEASFTKAVRQQHPFVAAAPIEFRRFDPLFVRSIFI